MAVKTSVRAVANVKAEERMSDLVAQIMLITDNRLVLKTEPHYQMFLLAELGRGSVVTYLVTDDYALFGGKNCRRFTSYLEARDFYAELVSVGSWAEFHLELNRREILKEANLRMANSEIFRGDVYLGELNHEDSVMTPSPYMMRMTKPAQVRIWEAIKAFHRVK